MKEESRSQSSLQNVIHNEFYKKRKRKDTTTKRIIVDKNSVSKPAGKRNPGRWINISEKYKESASLTLPNTW